MMTAYGVPTVGTSLEPEELEDKAVRKRRRLNKLVGDSETQLSSVEGRCESGAEDRRPAHVGGPTTSRALDRALDDVLADRLANVGRAPAADRPLEPKKIYSPRPSNLDLSAEVPITVLPPNEASMVHDAQPRPASAGIEPAAGQPQRGRSTHGSEGSEDKTQVSLGESERITDFQGFLREQWGVHGTMFKIYECVKKGIPGITVHKLVQRYSAILFNGSPVIEARRKIIESRCFTSIRKLENNGFIKVLYDNETNAIKHIELGPRIINN